MAQQAKSDTLELGRRSYGRREWTEAHRLLAGVDRATPLGADDLGLLATAAYMLGRDAEHVACLERAHRLHLDLDEPLRAARCAWWIHINLLVRGEPARSTGWLGRARRLVERDGRDRVERGYLKLSLMFEREGAGDRAGAIAAADDALAAGERFGDPDLIALAAQDQGMLLIKEGRVADGLRLLDEAMVAVTAGELSPIVNGLVYCGVITSCQAAHDPRRAQEWTDALTSWCEQQPDMVSFSGTCLVHRAELMQLHGAWPHALEEARRAGERCAAASNSGGVAQAHYRRGELHRLRGELSSAERAYADARRAGLEPQPGLALLWLAQGRGDAAAAALSRLLDETPEPSSRTGLLAAGVEILLGQGDVAGAHRACDELDRIAAGWEGPMVGAIAAHARGAVELADGDARGALASLRHAGQAWRELGAPYEEARTTVLVGLACRQLGDETSAEAELQAAAATFTRLEATPDLERIETIATAPDLAAEHGLTARELEVLRHVAAGRSNRQIAAELVISEHTVARHLQNIFAKLGVPSRTAAASFAFEHGLI